MKTLPAMLLISGLSIFAQAGAYEVDTPSGLQSLIENAVLSRLPDPVGDLVNTVRAAPDVVKSGTLLWLNRKMVNAAAAGDDQRVDCYQAFFSCLATNDCQALATLQRAMKPSDDAASMGGAMEWNIDRMGQDYSDFNLAEADPALCQNACAQQASCKAWTYVKPNTIQGPHPRCWLKSAVPEPRLSECCVSGVHG